MKKRNVIGALSLIICITILQTTLIKGVLFTVTDPSGDVELYSDYSLIITSMYIHPEIDIVSLEIIEGIGSLIEVTFVAQPINTSRSYNITVFWSGDDNIGNWTKAIWSEHEHSVTTRIEDSSGGEIVEDLQLGIIDLSGNKLRIPCTYVALSPTVQANPNLVKVNTYYYLENPGDSYQDDLTHQNMPAPGYNFWITIIGIFTIVVIGIIVRKKRG